MLTKDQARKNFITYFKKYGKGMEADKKGVYNFFLDEAKARYTLDGVSLYITHHKACLAPRLLVKDIRELAAAQNV